MTVFIIITSFLGCLVSLENPFYTKTMLWPRSQTSVFFYAYVPGIDQRHTLDIDYNGIPIVDDY